MCCFSTACHFRVCCFRVCTMLVCMVLKNGTKICHYPSLPFQNGHTLDTPPPNAFARRVHTCPHPSWGLHPLGNPAATTRASRKVAFSQFPKTNHTLICLREAFPKNRHFRCFHFVLLPFRHLLLVDTSLTSNPKGSWKEFVHVFVCVCVCVCVCVFVCVAGHKALTVARLVGLECAPYPIIVKQSKKGQ